MPLFHYVASFTLADKRMLECDYYVREYPESIDCPADADKSDPTYRLDGRTIDYADLPKGLGRIADQLYDENPPEVGSIREVPVIRGYD